MREVLRIIGEPFHLRLAPARRIDAKRRAWGTPHALPFLPLLYFPTLALLDQRHLAHPRHRRRRGCGAMSKTTSRYLLHRAWLWVTPLSRRLDHEAIKIQLPVGSDYG